VLVLFPFAAGGTVRAQGVITTFAGNELVFSGNGKPALGVPLGYIASVAADSSGNFYLTDNSNRMVMRVGVSGVLEIVAGNGIQGSTGDGGLAVAASLGSPLRIALGGGNL
jgi:hypothetical protein